MSTTASPALSVPRTARTLDEARRALKRSRRIARAGTAYQNFQSYLRTAKSGKMPPAMRGGAQIFWPVAGMSRTLLDSLETSVLHETRRCYPERAAYRARYLEDLAFYARDDNDDRRVLKMKDCSSTWNVIITQDGPRLETWRCRDRLCTVCQQLRAIKYRHGYESYLTTARHPKMLTLTIATLAIPAGESLDRLYRSFRLLRRRSVWRAHCTGGYTVAEITPGRAGIGWHVHLHVLMDCAYIPVSWLRAEWYKITTDSHQVHIQVADPSTAKYVAAYASKGISGLDERSAWWEMADALRGRRMAQSFGDAPPLNAEAPQSDVTAINIGDLRTVIANAHAGDVTAIEIIDGLRAHYGRVDGDAPPSRDPAVRAHPCLQLE